MSEKNQKAGLAIAVGILFLLGLAAKPSEDKPDPDPKPGPDPDPDPVPVGPDGFIPVPTPDGPNPPFNDIVTPDLPGTDGWPEPGKFYQVRGNDNQSMLRIASRALYTGAYQAAKQVGGLSDEDADAFADAFRSNATRQANFANDIQCESWNDAVYSTFGFGNKAQEAPSGRAMRLLPQHANNLQRLRNEQRPQRRQRYGKDGDQKTNKQSGSGSKHELLYIPGLDLNVLWNVGVVQLGGEWPDGASKANPPTWVLDLGVKDLTGTIPKGNILRGCEGRPRVKVNVM